MGWNIDRIFKRLDELEFKVNKIYEALDLKKSINCELDLLFKYKITKEEFDKLEKIVKRYHELNKNDTSSKNIFEYNVYSVVEKEQDNEKFPEEVAKAYSSVYSNVYRNFYL